MTKEEALNIMERFTFIQMELLKPIILDLYTQNEELTKQIKKLQYEMVELRHKNDLIVGEV